MRFFHMRERGFALVEVVVAAGIVAVLATVVFVNVSEARKKARDVQRVSDLSQLQIALKLYNDVYGTYKVDGAGEEGEGVGWVSYASDGEEIVLPPDDGGEIMELPIDNPPGGGGYEEIPGPYLPPPDQAQEAQLIGGIYTGGDYELTGEGHYPEAVTKALYDEGFLPVPYLNDPNPPEGDYGYLLLLCENGRRYTLFATKEIPSESEQDQAADACGGQGREIMSQYGKNYSVGN